MIGNSCSAAWLSQQLQQQLLNSGVGFDDDVTATGNGSEDGGVLVLDCRSADEYNESHVTGSFPVAVPSIMMRRLQAGSIPVRSVVGGGEAGRAAFTQRLQTVDHIVLYDSCGAGGAGNDVSGIVAVLMTRLKADGCHACYLEGGFESFREQFGNLCVIGHPRHNLLDDTVTTTLSLSNLRLSSSAPSGTSFLAVGNPHRQHRHRPIAYQSPTNINSASSDESPPSSAEAPPISKPGVGGLPFPVEVLPHLYLGDAENSRDWECLRRHNIRYIVNVTDDVANSFDSDPTFTYMRIPITDHWSETLTAFFTKAISFIDEGRNKEQGVLVHCLAGISRSVTVTVAYLMYTMRMSMDDAYDFLRRSRPNISPNFNFMGQLKDFEQTLQHARQHCTCIYAAASPGGGEAPAAGTQQHTVPAPPLAGICSRCCRQVKTYFSSPTCVLASAALGESDAALTSSSASSPFSMTSSSSAYSLPSPLAPATTADRH